MAGHVGAGAGVLSPLAELIRRHVFAPQRMHGDDTTVPVLAKAKTITDYGLMCATTGRLPRPSVDDLGALLAFAVA